MKLNVSHGRTKISSSLRRGQYGKEGFDYCSNFESGEAI